MALAGRGALLLLLAVLGRLGRGHVPLPLPLTAPPPTPLPPEDGVVYIGVALAGVQEQTMARVVHRALANLTRDLLQVEGSPLNVTLSPLLLSLPASAPGPGAPGGGSSGAVAVMENLCSLVGGRRVAAVLVVGGGPPALSAALAAVTAGIPVLWARGAGSSSPGFSHQELSSLEVRLEPGSRQVVDALRALLLATHWHSFTLMTDEAASASVILRGDLAALLRATPLHPTVIHLRSNAAPHAIFRRLADVSRSTRGVVVLMCDEKSARMIMAEARRLNMVDGHFVWLWLDTRAHNPDPVPTHSPQDHGDSLQSAPSGPAGRRPRNSDTRNTTIPTTPHDVQPTSSQINSSSTPSSQRVPRLAEYSTAWPPPLDYRSTTFRSPSADDSKPAWSHWTMMNDLPPTAAVNIQAKLKQASWTNLPRAPGHSAQSSSQSNMRGGSFKAPPPLPIGMLALRRQAMRLDRHVVKGGLRIIVEALRRTGAYSSAGAWLLENAHTARDLDCFSSASLSHRNFSSVMTKELRAAAAQALAGKADWLDEKSSKALVSSFQIQNLVPDPSSTRDRDRHHAGDSDVDNGVEAVDEQGETVPAVWRGVGRVLGRSVELDTIVWPGGELVVPGLSSRARSVFRIVTALAPPFVMEAELDEDGQCLRGLPCHRLLARGKDNLTLVFSELEQTQERQDEDNDVDTVDEDVAAADDPRGYTGDSGSERREDRRRPSSGGEGKEDEPRTSDRNVRFFVDGSSGEDFDLPRYKYRTSCCYGLAMDLLENIAQELEFDFHLYVVPDGVFGSQVSPGPASSWHQGSTGSPTTPHPTHASGHHYYQHQAPLHHLQQQQQQQQQQHNAQHSSPHATPVAVSHVTQPPPSRRHNPPAPTRHPTRTKWNGIVGDLASGAAHMSFAALSVSSARSEVMDFSVPFFYSGVSFLAAPTQRSEIPLHAFLLPFSPELWIAIFLSLNLTALAVAVYEWLSPFGLNPWGRQRSKNFSIASALWVMWGLLCGHLVAFKAPKSWPNKFLINVWGGFSVLFVASYTANIAALIAGLFFHNAVSNYHDRSLLSQRVGAPRHSSADYYVHRSNPHLWQHMQRYSVANLEEGVQKLRNGSLDILIADTPILDYYRATDHGCKLQKFGDDAINEDTYAVGMTKGFPLKDSISAVIAKYTSNGYMDILQEKWYGGLPCFKLATDMAQPRPLGVAAVAGVFILLGLGMVVGCLILVVEHLFYRYTLPILRHKPKGTIWKSRNIMFFSQKLYRFINCVELVSPHHAARELVHTIRQGQITSLFQKSVKRKEHEQRRRRKSKAQFFEMIQEIRRVQQEERAESHALEGVLEAPEPTSPDDVTSPTKGNPSPCTLRPDRLEQRRHSKSPSRLDKARRLSRELFSRSPRGEEASGGRSAASSSASLNVRRFSSEAALSPRLLGDLSQACSAIGRRLSRGSTSPPDLNSRRASNLDVGKSPLPDRDRSTSRSASRVFNGRNNGGGAGAPPGPAGIVAVRLAGATPEVALQQQQLQQQLQTKFSTLQVQHGDQPGITPSQVQDLPTAEEDDTFLEEKEESASERERTSAYQLAPKLPPKKRLRSADEGREAAGSSSGGAKSRSRSCSSGTGSAAASTPTSGDKDLPAPFPSSCLSKKNPVDVKLTPLNRLSREELLALWRSPESELRDHLLRAIRDKEEEVVDPP